MRLISRIDIKNDYVVKGICFEGLRKIGNPETLCKSIMIKCLMNY